tara:strand:+ start:449 stop:628 length:180 start_codon:yes stop_codon:yes gene_type:complete
MVRYPEEENDSLINIVEIMNPVFLINLLYSSVYLKEINKIITSAKINRVKNLLKKRPSI